MPAAPIKRSVILSSIDFWDECWRIVRQYQYPRQPNSILHNLQNLVEAGNMGISILNPWKIGGFTAGVESGATRDFCHKALDLAAEIGASRI